MVAPPVVEKVVAAIRASRKYAHTSEATVRAIAHQLAPQHRKAKALDKAVRKRLHGIVADHLGDPDYAALSTELVAAVRGGDRQRERELCEHALGAHLSTRERWPYVERFYAEIFALTGPPDSILDLACALGPLAMPWMGLPASAHYYAYDIHEPRVACIDAYLRARGQPGGAQVRDIVLDPVDCTERPRAHVALLLKELHRLQRNYFGGHGGAEAGPDWLASIPARHLVVSLPAVSAHGGRRLTEPYRAMMARFIEGRGYAMQELLFPHEIVFCIDTA